MNSHFLEVRIVLLHFDTVGGIPTVLGRDVAADTRYIRVLLLSAFQDYLDPCLLLSLPLLLKIIRSWPSLAARSGRQYLFVKWYAL